MSITVSGKRVIGEATPNPDHEVISPEWSSSLVLNENWDTLDTGKWDVESSTYGWDPDGNPRIQRYRPENAVISAATAGGAGNSLKLVSKRETYIDRDFTAGQVSTRDLGVYYPRYGRYEARMRIPWGHGVWPAFWLRHRDGSNICEPDIMEGFIAQRPGCMTWQLHRTNNAGTYQTNLLSSNGWPNYHAIEQPVAEGSQTWHTISMDIVPWTASTYAGGTYGDPDAANTNVAYIVRVDGTVRGTPWVDTQSTNWTQRYSDQAFDICIQGSQIGGCYVGHPDDPVGYTRWGPSTSLYNYGTAYSDIVQGSPFWDGGCIVGGTPPNSCTVTVGGYTNRVADFPNTFEIDYVRVWRYEGAA